MDAYIAVDIGGTQIRAARYPGDSLTPEQIERTPTHDPSATPLEHLQTLIEKVWPEKQSILGIGLAAPGPLDPYQGVILETPNIPGWINFPIQQLLTERFNVPVAIGNDANLAALGEWKFGAGKGHHHLIYLTISTGIGGGVIIDDRLLLGRHGLAAELGHVTVLPDGPRCPCGQQGHLEAVASGPAIANWVEKKLASGAASSLPVDQPLTALQIGFAAQHGDDLSIRALARAGTFIGQALADFIHVFNPSIVVIGGGVSQSGEMLFAPLRSALRQRVLSPRYVEELVVTRPAFGDEAGLMGSLALIGDVTHRKE